MISPPPAIWTGVSDSPRTIAASEIAQTGSNVLTSAAVAAPTRRAPS
jgi:hypothetical protein